MISCTALPNGLQTDKTVGKKSADKSTDLFMLQLFDKKQSTPMSPNSLFGHVLKNLRVFYEFQRLGVDYIVNPETGELHKAAGGTLSGPHSLAFADLENFIGLANIDSIPAHWNFDGTPIPIYDLVTGELVGEYPLNKCKHCYPHLT